MHRSLSLVTPPASEPISIAEARAWSGIEGEDALVAGYIAAARQTAEDYLCRSLTSQTWKVTLDLPCSNLRDLPEGVYDLPVSALYSPLPSVIRLPRGPVQSIALVTTYDAGNVATVMAPSAYRADTAGDRLILNSGSSWPIGIRPQAGIEIVYICGFTSVPASIKRAIASIISAMLTDLEISGNVKTRKAGDATITRFDTGSLDRSAVALLAPYRVVQL